MAAHHLIDIEAMKYKFSVYRDVQLNLSVYNSHHRFLSFIKGSFVSPKAYAQNILLISKMLPDLFVLFSVFIPCPSPEGLRATYNNAIT